VLRRVTPQAALDSLAGALAGTFPAADDAPLARALLRLLARGRPVGAQLLAAAVDRPEPDVRAALARWPNVQRDDAGSVVAFSGLSLRRTPHRFTVAGRELFTWCAWDGLFLPAILDEPAAVASTCPVTGTPVRIEVAPDRILDADPREVWVSFPAPDRTSTADVVGSFCCHVHFLAGRGAAERWLGRSEGGRVLDLPTAHALGSRCTECLRATGPAGGRRAPPGRRRGI
jgi:alkylmercury lyase